MAKITEHSVRGKNARITEYNDFAEILAIIEQNDRFHDGTVEFIAHNSIETVIGFKHYKDHKIYRLVLTGNIEFSLELDLLQRYIYEIRYAIDKRIEVFFDGTGILTKADHVKLQIQEPLDQILSELKERRGLCGK